MRTPIMAGNWKMYKTVTQTIEYFDKFLPLVENVQSREIVICPPYLSLSAALQKTQDTSIRIGAQNLHQVKEGAYTGEVSAPMLKETGVEFVIIGHSERRQHFCETDQFILEKTRAALASGLLPIVCVGEHLDQRENGQTDAVLTEQFAHGCGGLTPEEFSQVVLAYEPVWAIGTGRTATPEIAQDAHLHLRNLVANHYGQQIADATRILYGGSVKPDNIKGLMAQPDIDGGLVGGAS